MRSTRIHTGIMFFISFTLLLLASVALGHPKILTRKVRMCGTSMTQAQSLAAEKQFPAIQTLSTERITNNAANSLSDHRTSQHIELRLREEYYLGHSRRYSQDWFNNAAPGMLQQTTMKAALR
ncbi:hypothetical protein B0H11DRAFT_2200562 [Mycena galericulata]|nr:hypothetical protein B0H11DRAFT_2200562 [Mycena galericulata]